MKILIVHNTLNDSRSLSGALRHFLYVSEVWNEMGHRTDYLCARAGFPQIGSLAPSSRLISSDGIFDATTYVNRTWRYFPAYGYRMLSSHLTRFPERYDVVLSSSQLIVEVYPALAIARRHQAKFVAKVHHVLATQGKRVTFFDRLFLWSERKTVRWMSKYADLVICGTRFVENDYKKLEGQLGVKPAPTAASGYGVDLQKLPDSSGFSKEYDVVHLGRLHEHKGVRHLPELWKQVVALKPGARLLVIGEGPHRAAVEQGFRDTGLWDLVRFTGGISEEEKDGLLCKSRVGLSLSYEEGWGLSVNEFLGAALPVVAFHLPIFDHVFPGQLIQVPLGDSAAAAREIVRLLHAPEECQRVGQRGREFVARYDFRNVARQELEMIQSLFK